MPGRRHRRKKSSEEDTSSLEVPSGTQMMLGLLNPDEVEALGGVPREAIVGELMRAPLPEDPFDLQNFRLNPRFVEFLHFVVARWQPHDPDFAAWAQHQPDGRATFCDGRASSALPERQGDYAIGSFEVHGGRIIADTYEPNPEFKPYSELGAVNLTLFVRERYVHELAQIPTESRVFNAANFRTTAIRLYQTDDVLKERLTAGVSGVAAYCKFLEQTGSEYFRRLRRDFGSLGILIVVGIKPIRKTKLWCDVIDGELPDDVWNSFVGLLEDTGSELRPAVRGPFAFALECALGAGPSIEFPAAPTAWQAPTERHRAPLAVPDELFELVFPD